MNALLSPLTARSLEEGAHFLRPQVKYSCLDLGLRGREVKLVFVARDLRGCTAKRTCPI